MRVSFSKNGIVKGGGVTESSSQSLCNFSIRYTPAAATNNDCMERKVTGITENHTYIVAATISWKFASFPDNFYFRLQGSQHHKTDGWGWTTDYIPCAALMKAMGSTDNLTAFAKSNPTYAKRIIAEFTCAENYDGYEIGCRCNYADGNSWVKIADVLIIPKEYYVGSNQLKLYSNEIVADNFIEY